MGFSLIRNSIQRVMTQGDVAESAFSSPSEWVLYACSQVYQLAARSRIHLYENGILEQKSLPCKVVSIGNITMGGTGKTPMVHYVASLLKGLGLKVAVISRGYGGYTQRSGGIVSDGKTTFMGLRASGDEPQLLASKLKGIPLLVGKDRYRAGRRAISRFGASVLVLDDAFQHLPLKRDLDLLLLDSTRPFGNGYYIPRGTLREPVEQIKRASTFVLTRWTEDSNLTRGSSMIEPYVQGRPIFRCMHVPETLFVPARKKALDLSSLKGRRLFAFSGIARNEFFRETIAKLEGHVAGFLEFPDHHRYAHHDLGLIWRRARDLNVDNIITTEKDYVNILTEIPSMPQLFVLAISISFGDDTEAFTRYLKSELSSLRSQLE
ncbi:MAG: tetraacyldisaccharide 4'-kinase [Desulfobacterales bacterium]|nr:tetraacyldisaccharide 4'-kinase [Desulfobacterales bacterium]